MDKSSNDTEVEKKQERQPEDLMASSEYSNLALMFEQMQRRRKIHGEYNVDAADMLMLVRGMRMIAEDLAKRFSGGVDANIVK